MLSGASHHPSWVLLWLSLSLTALLIGCGGGGSGDSEVLGNSNNGSSQDTVFSGGSLEDLRSLNSSLTFRALRIDGPLKLPIAQAAEISVESLEITENGSIGYDFGTCEYRDAPSLRIQSEGTVTINGDILLGGRSGTSVTSGASCNRCTGQNGGDLLISSDENITVNARIFTDGGDGASFRSVGFPSSPCSSGDAGDFKLLAVGNVVLDNVDIDADSGRNFAGGRGSSGDSVITAGGDFLMQGGTFVTTGELVFSAANADITGEIFWGTLSESIGGLPDNTPPALSLISPISGSVIEEYSVLDIQIQASDQGMGLRSVEVTGFGFDETFTAVDFIEDELVVSIDPAVSPAELQIVATDNAGFQTTLENFGLSLLPVVEIEPNETFVHAQTIRPGQTMPGDVITGDTGVAYSAVQDYLQAEGDRAFRTRLVEDSYQIPMEAGQDDLFVFVLWFPSSPNLDIYLLDESGELVGVSNKPGGAFDNALDGDGESIRIPANPGETYHLLIQAFDVPQRVDYTITRFDTRP